nr:uncharacterized protein LOC129163840 [Nothobranchius furzeri]
MAAQAGSENQTGLPDEPPTSYSLLDMELFELPGLATPLEAISPVPVSRKLDECTQTVNCSGSHPDQTQYQLEIGEIKLDIAELSKGITSQMEQLKERLTESFMEQQKQLVKHVDTRVEYLRTQLDASLGWRLKDQYTEITTKLIPDIIQPVKEELSLCLNTLHTMAEELTSTRLNPSMGQASVQTMPDDLGGRPLGHAGHPRLQSTIRSSKPNDLLDSPRSTAIQGETRGRLAGKAPIKVQFPTFGRIDDSSDPLQYLERCEDFLALNPLTDEELMATLRNVLHGTSRDWWDVARHKVQTWTVVNKQFRAAFLSEDYEDELAERVRNRIQEENEGIRDFAYMYQSLCKRWKPSITEGDVVKLILKNINPQLASQLRSRVTSVDELVRLGQQLEKDQQNQLQYEQRKGLRKAVQKPPSNLTPTPSTTQTTQRQLNPAASTQPQVYCWRCKGHHAPASCPQWRADKNRAPNVSSPQTSSNPQRQLQGPFHSLSPHTQQGATASVSYFPAPAGTSMPCQLMMPLNVGAWSGTAILDTGSSYTLINENVWSTVRDPQEILKPWTRGPLYLADGESRQPLGWSELKLTIQSATVTLPCVILPGKSLAFPAVVGLDFIFFSGLQFDVSENSYWFKANKHQRYLFISASAGKPGNHSQPHVAFFSAMTPAQLISPPHNYLEMAVQNAHLDDFGKKQLLYQLQNNKHICTNSLGRTNLLTHKIFLTHNVPIKQKPYRVSPFKLQVIKEHVQEMLEKDIIEPSTSPYASPVVLVPKKLESKPRFCVDYRKLNAVTRTDAYPIPNIQEILESLVGAAIFTTLDLNSGYWQVQMEEESREKTAFISPLGLYQFKVMPFGLKNAPATFQRLMEVVLGDLRGKNCFVYLDDIIVYSSTPEQHRFDLQAVFDKLQMAKLTVNMKKSHFFRTSLKFLGHVVSSSGVEVDAEKTKAVQDFPVPQNIKELQRFLGIAGWYHRFVPGFSQLTEPLHALKRRGAKYIWTPQCQAAFETLKKYLVSPPILGHPDFNLPFIVYTDASEVGLGAVLTQPTGLGTEQVLAFASRTLNKAERNYSTTEQECLAVVWALEKWRYYLEGRHFTVVTDHSSLVWVFKTTKPSTRLIRWALRLQEFSFTVEYRKGRYNTVPDALSRAPVDLNQIPTCAAVLGSLKDSSPELHITDEDIWKAQQMDPDIQSLYEKIIETG